MNARHVWTPEQLAYLREHYPHRATPEIAAALGLPVPAVYYRAHKDGLHKTPEALTRMAHDRIARYGHTGTLTRFQKGQRAWNTGMKGLDTGGYAGRFVKGRRNHNWRPIGSTRISLDGTLQRKVSDTKYTPRDWRSVHALVWEAAHGPIPKGHVVIFRPGRRTTVEADITLDAVELVSHRELMARNSVHTRQSPELARVTQLRGALARQINKRSKTHGQ